MHMASLRLGDIKKKVEDFGIADDPNTTLVWVSRTGSLVMEETIYPVVEDVQNLTSILYGFGTEANYYYKTVVINPAGKIEEVGDGPASKEAVARARQKPQGLLTGLTLPDGGLKAEILKLVRCGFLDELEIRLQALIRKNENKEFATALLARITARRDTLITSVRTLTEKGVVGEAWQELQALKAAFPKCPDIAKLEAALKGLKTDKTVQSEVKAALTFADAMAKFASTSPGTAKQAPKLITQIAEQFTDTWFGRLAVLLEEQRKRVEAADAAEKTPKKP
jgi:hypothetical protein